MNTIKTFALGCVLALGAGPAGAAGDIERGAKIAETACAVCHGKEGNSDAPTFPRLAGQYADYIARALYDYRSGDRQNAVMAATLQSRPLSDQDIEDVSAYFSVQSGSLYTIEYED